MNEKKDKNQKEHKNILKNTFYSFLNSYGGIILSLITTFIMARLVSQELWGYLILTLSYITIITLILTFLPPNLHISLNFYVPRYRAEGNNNQLKSIIKFALILKTIFLIPIFILSLILFYYFSELFDFNLNNYSYLLLIVAPLIIINGIDGIIKAVFRGFDRYNIIVYLLLVQKMIHIGGLLYLFFGVNTIRPEDIAMILLISSAIPFILSCTIFLSIYVKIPKTEEKGFSLKDVSQKTFKYGTFMSFATLSGNLRRQVETQAIGTVETPDWVTGYKVSSILHGFVLTATDSVLFPLINSFAKLDVKKDLKQANLILKTIFKYSLIIICITSGIMFFIADFLLIAFLGDSYLRFSFILKLILLSTIFRALEAPFGAFMRGFGKIKYQPYFSIVSLSIRLPFFFFGLIYFGLVGAIIFGLIISRLLVFFVEIIFGIRIFNLNLGLKKILLIYIVFGIAIGAGILLEVFIQESLDIILFQGIFYFEYIDFFGILLFIVIFLIAIMFLRFITLKEIEQLEGFFTSDNIFKKFLKIFKKLIRT